MSHPTYREMAEKELQRRDITSVRRNRVHNNLNNQVDPGLSLRSKAFFFVKDSL